MCGRATLTTPSLAAVAAIVDDAFDPADTARYRPRFNFAPTDPHWIVTFENQHRRIGPAVWGIGGKQRPLVIMPAPRRPR